MISVHHLPEHDLADRAVSFHIGKTPVEVQDKSGPVLEGHFPESRFFDQPQ